MMFEKGDLVRCVGTRGNCLLTLGDLYTVASVFKYSKGTAIFISGEGETYGSSMGPFHAHCFGVVKQGPTFKTGDIVKYREYEAELDPRIERGREYEVERAGVYKGTQLLYLRGVSGNRFASRFERVKRSKQYSAPFNNFSYDIKDYDCVVRRVKEQRAADAVIEAIGAWMGIAATGEEMLNRKGEI